MFERFTERARQVVVLAQNESRGLGQPWIGTEHLLLGVLREDGEPAEALTAAGLSLDAARKLIVELVGDCGERIVAGQIPFTPQAKRALEASFNQSVRLREEVTPRLLLLGVLIQRSDTAACVLRDAGIDVGVVAAALDFDQLVQPGVIEPDGAAKPERTCADPYPLVAPVAGSPKVRPVTGSAEAEEGRFTERARQVMVLAQDEARALKHNYVGTEHILLGLLREEEGLAARALASLGVTVEDVRVQVVEIVGEGDEVVPGQIPFTPRSKKVLELALIPEALSLGHNYVGTEHILLGLVRENEGVGVRILRDAGIDSEAVREQVIAILSGPGRRGVPVRGAAQIGEATRALTIGDLFDPIRDRTVGDLIDALDEARVAAVKNGDLKRKHKLEKIAIAVATLAEDFAVLRTLDQDSE